MKHRKICLLSVLLALCLLLSSCGFSADFIQKMSVFGHTTAFEDMQYTHPDMEILQQSLDNCIALSQYADSADDLMDAVYDFYTQYDNFYTNSALADIYYSCDLSDTNWEAEYNYCAGQAPTVEAALEELFCALAKSPWREELEQNQFFGEGFFDGYEIEPTMDAQTLALLEQEAELISEYYTLSDRYTAADYTLDDALYEDMASLYIRLIQTRQELATYLGYPDYPTLAYDMYYLRDYTPQEAADYMTQLGEALYAPYVALADSDVWDEAYGYCNEYDTYAYLQVAADSMGGLVADAFDCMDENGLYHIRYGENKLNSSFETYIWNYYAPFVFMNPYLDHTDKLALAHEFGHFAADYSCDGTFCGTDIAEVHSMGMEYLSLCYTPDAQMLTRYKLADSLYTYMEQSAFSLFEYQVYLLQGEELTEENISALYQQVGTQFGFDAFDWDPREYVTVLHFFSDPMYTVSYVLSNDLAMQIYQMELAEPGKGLSLYEEMLPSQESFILTFVEDYGLENPFSPQRLQAVSELFKNNPF